MKILNFKVYLYQVISVTHLCSRISSLSPGLLSWEHPPPNSLDLSSPLKQIFYFSANCFPGRLIGKEGMNIFLEYVLNQHLTQIDVNKS